MNIKSSCFCLLSVVNHNQEKIRDLSENDRKIIKQSLDFLKNNEKLSLNNQIFEVINKLNDKKIEKRESSSLIVSFLKGLQNIFHLRISSHDIKNEIQEIIDDKSILELEQTNSDMAKAITAIYKKMQSATDTTEVESLKSIYHDLNNQLKEINDKNPTNNFFKNSVLEEIEKNPQPLKLSKDQVVIDENIINTVKKATIEVKNEPTKNYDKPFPSPLDEPDLTASNAVKRSELTEKITENEVLLDKVKNESSLPLAVMQRATKMRSLNEPDLTASKAKKRSELTEKIRENEKLLDKIKNEFMLPFAVMKKAAKFFESYGEENDQDYVLEALEDEKGEIGKEIEDATLMQLALDDSKAEDTPELASLKLYKESLDELFELFNNDDNANEVNKNAFDKQRTVWTQKMKEAENNSKTYDSRIIQLENENKVLRDQINSLY